MGPTTAHDRTASLTRVIMSSVGRVEAALSVVRRTGYSLMMQRGLAGLGEALNSGGCINAAHAPRPKVLERLNLSCFILVP